MEILKIKPVHEFLLSDFFCCIKLNDLDKYFHPHPFTEEEAKKIAYHTGDDLYYIIINDSKIIGYGMLRGWDDGYSVPSLGIAIHPDEFNKGLGKMFVHFLHLAAKQKGASKIRLTVEKENINAITLYKNFGYKLQDHTSNSLVGYKDL